MPNKEAHTNKGRVVGRVRKKKKSMSSKRSFESLEGDGEQGQQQQQKKRKSRFDKSDDTLPANAAALKAAQLTATLRAQTPSASTVAGSSSSSVGIPNVNDIHAQIQAQIASVTSALQSAKQEKKAAPVNRTLRLDAMGREVDEHGNVVKSSGPVRTLAIHVAEGHALKKKENPYLTHKSSTLTGNSNENPSIESEFVEDSNDQEASYDDRLRVRNREAKRKKAFNFVESGTYIAKEDALMKKEERKVIAGYTSGRKAPEIVDDGGGVNANDAIAGVKSVFDIDVPPPNDENLVPSMEWYDEIFLPKDLKEKKKLSRAALEQDNFDSLSLQNCRTYRFIQHPVAVKALGGEIVDEAMTMYLTKKERKKIRRQKREERERERRDMQMIGLIKAPEPKFKLSNFMKILGDQAVADPSKVEQRVMQQIHERQLKHEMRNLSAKLTPAEKRDKLRRKMTEDTSKQAYVAVFRVRDLSSAKHKFKVDVNAQQFNLSGAVLMCESIKDNLVVVEGGLKGIKKFIRLMLHRVNWDVVDAPENPVDFDDEDIDEHNDYDEAENDDNKILAKSSGDVNRCDLLWQGLVPKRYFQGFRFQECRTALAARKVLEAKGLSHYWDLVMRADEIIDADKS